MAKTAALTGDIVKCQKRSLDSYNRTFSAEDDPLSNGENATPQQGTADGTGASWPFQYS